MKNITVAARLGIGFSVVILLLLVVAAIGISRLSILNENVVVIEKKVEMVSLSK